MNMPTMLATPTLPKPVAAPSASGNWLALTLRLIRWELFQTWRRVMTKVLLGILLGLYAIVVGFVLLAYAVSSNSSPDGGNAVRTWLTFPLSIAVAAEYTGFVGVVLLCILAGVLMGNEYGYGTQRLALSWGVGRGQALAAKIVALAVVAAGIVGAMMLLGAALGMTVGPVLGGAPDGLTPNGLFQLATYWGATSLRLFAYSLIALFFATLGRSAAAGIGGALGFVAVEVVGLLIITGIVTYERTLALVQHVSAPAFVDALDGVRQSFLKTNADALVGASHQGPLNLTLFPDISQTGVSVISVIATPSAVWALVVILLWCATLVGLSYLFVRTRDVTD